MGFVQRLSFKRKVSKVQPTSPFSGILEKQPSDSEATAPLWQSESSLSLGTEEKVQSNDAKSATQVQVANSIPPKKVSFSSVEVREYGLIVGDSPDIEDGFPLMLDWAHSKDTKIVSVDKHQEQVEALDRSPIEELDMHQRRLRLRSMGYTEAELRRAERRRRVQLSHEWAYGMNKNNPPPFLKASYVDNYIK